MGIDNETVDTPVIPEKKELYKKAGELALESLKFILTTAITILGVFFITLTGKDRPTFCDNERGFLVTAIVLLVTSVTCGIIAWTLHALFYGASASDSKWKELWRCLRKVFLVSFIVFFCSGLICSCIYIIKVSSHPYSACDSKTS